MSTYERRCHHDIDSALSHPPDLPEEQMQSLVDEIKDYQITHGSLIKLVRHEEPHTVPAIPIGVSLFPTPFPRTCYEKAVSLMPICNKLYARVAQDEDWLSEVLKDLREIDEFVRTLWDIKAGAKKQGLVQDLSLGVFRSDYMLHGDSVKDAVIKQVEMNTVSVAGGTHANIVSDMHHSLRQRGMYKSLCPDAKNDCDALPVNGTIKGIVDGLVEAHGLYGSPRAPNVKGLCILMTVQPFNVNICDERPLEYALHTQHNIPTFRITFAEDILDRTILTESRQLLFYEYGVPSLGSDTSRAAVDQAWEVSVVYHRAGYEPREYADASGLEARLRIETSWAIKCPSVGGHLATLKHVQRALCEPGALERFLPPNEAMLVKTTFMPMYSLESGSDGEEIARSIAENEQEGERYVLKPSLEGGGHNVFGRDIGKHLRKDREEGNSWKKYILMEMIRPPAVGGCMISPRDVYEGQVISELGSFGMCIWRERLDGHARDLQPNGADDDIVRNEWAGWSLKTKDRSVTEMSVIKGWGAFDSPILID